MLGVKTLADRYTKGTDTFFLLATVASGLLFGDLNLHPDFYEALLWQTPLLKVLCY